MTKLHRDLIKIERFIKMTHSATDTKTINDRKETLEKVKEKPWALGNLSPELKDDIEVVTTAVNAYGRALEYASARLQGNRKIVRMAVTNNGLALKHASSVLQGDKKIVLAAVNEHGRALKHASEELKNNEEVAHAAVRNEHFAIDSVHGELKKRIKLFRRLRMHIRELKQYDCFIARPILALVIMWATAAAQEKTREDKATDDQSICSIM